MNNTAQSRFSDANQAFRKNDYKFAIKLYKDCLKYSNPPLTAQINFNLALALRKLNAYQQKISESHSNNATHHLVRRAIPLVELKPDSRRIIVYSVLVGGYEPIRPPEVMDPNVRYILFTDNSALIVDHWEIVYFDTLGLSPRRASRLPKLLPHHYLPDHDVSIYLDASLSLRVSDVSEMTKGWLQNYDIAAYPHFERDCIFDEIEECLRLGKSDPTLTGVFYERLKKEQFPRNWGLLENAFLVRRNTPMMRRINELWCTEYMAGAERDQFSLMYILWRASIPYSVIKDVNNFRKSSHLRWVKHKGATACAMQPPEAESLKQKLPFLREMSEKALCNKIEKILAGYTDSKNLLSSKNDERRTWDHMLEALVGLEYQDLPAAQTFRNKIAAQLFQNGAKQALTGSQRLQIAYIPNAAMPTLAANNVHVMKVCAAFKRIGVDIRLYSEKSVTPSCETQADIFCNFGIEENFPLTLTPKIASREYLLYSLVLQAIAEGCTHIYTRSVDAAVFAAIADVPTILEEHKAPHPASMVKHEFLARSPAFEKLVVISDALKHEFSACLRDIENKTLVLHDGADPVITLPEHFELDRSPGAVAHLGYVGHLYPGKGAELSYKIAQLMPHVDIHMLGGTPEDVAQWKERAKNLPNMKFYGHRPHSQVAAFTHTVDIAIAPFLRQIGVHGKGHHNIADFFSPLKIFEYMAQAKPIVTSDLPVLREVLADRHTAMMCNPDDPHTFVAAIEELIQNPKLAAELGGCARKVFEHSYTWKERARRICNLLTPPKITSSFPIFNTAIISTGDPKPMVRWHYGGKKQEGWAYGINAHRLSSRISSCRHIAPGSAESEIKNVDVSIAFDLLIMNGEKFRATNARRRILRVGGPNPLKVFSGGNRERLRTALAEADAIIALSPQIRDELSLLHPAVYFIPNGIDTAAFHPRVLQRALDRPFTVGMSASMSKEEQKHVKGYYFTQDACAKTGVELLVVGRGIKLIPHDRLIEDFYSQIDVLVHPVGAGKEASSNVIMEALSLGIPVITTRHAGFHGIALKNGKEALVVRRTVGDIAEAIKRLREDTALYANLVANGRGFVEHYHSLDVVARQYEQVIWKCLMANATQV